MTTLKEVEKALSKFKDEPLVKKWSSNDIIKMKLAKSYDAWMSDVDLHQCPFTLREFIETCIDTPDYIDPNK